MKAAIFEKYGSVDVLKMKEVDRPPIRSDSLLIRNSATSMNPIDCQIREGDFKIISGFTKPKRKILGFDIAGEVVDTGERVKKFSKGDLVYAYTGLNIGGGLAEYAVVTERHACLKPANMSLPEAASVPLTALTALQALRDIGKISRGNHVLINGATGGVGIFAVQIAKVFGVKVTGICSSKNTEFACSMGVDQVVDYTKNDITEIQGAFDLIFDVAANTTFSVCKPLLTPSGMFITTKPTPAVLLKTLVNSATSGKKIKAVMVKPSGKDLETIKDLIETQKVKTYIDKTFSLTEIADAHSYCGLGHTRGKSVITV